MWHANPDLWLIMHTPHNHKRRDATHAAAHSHTIILHEAGSNSLMLEHDVFSLVVEPNVDCTVRIYENCGPIGWLSNPERRSLLTKELIQLTRFVPYRKSSARIEDEHN
jgi:hypothetical protein